MNHGGVIHSGISEGRGERTGSDRENRVGIFEWENRKELSDWDFRTGRTEGDFEQELSNVMIRDDFELGLRMGKSAGDFDLRTYESEKPTEVSNWNFRMGKSDGDFETRLSNERI